MNLKATDLYDSEYPMSHTLPRTAIIDLMVKFHIKMMEHEKKLEKFNSEQFIGQHNLTEIRKRFKEDKK